MRRVIIAGIFRGLWKATAFRFAVDGRSKLNAIDLPGFMIPTANTRVFGLP